RLGRALERLQRFANDVALTEGVVYGDPSPEILIDGGRVSIIDWGTPSWGPLLHDIAAWLRFLELRDESDGASRFLAAYRLHQTVSAEELDGLPLFEEVHSALGL